MDKNCCKQDSGGGGEIQESMKQWVNVTMKGMKGMKEMKG